MAVVRSPGGRAPVFPFLHPNLLLGMCSAVPPLPISLQTRLGSSAPCSVTAPTWPCPATSSPVGE